MNTTALICLSVLVILSTLLLKGSVRLLAKNADNGWDNAIAYQVVTALLAIPARWMFDSDSILLTLLIPLFIWIAQTISIRVIYEVKAWNAWLIGVFHAFTTTMIVSGIGIVVAYFQIGRIISDPLKLIQFILKLIGIELPLG